MTAGLGLVRHGALLAAAGLVVVTGGTVAAPPATAADDRCAPGSGVTVVVDFGPLGGGTPIGCDPDGAGQPASQVVPRAGFSLDYVTNEPGFVCSVQRKPNPSSSCGRTPPANAYWGLFWSDGSSSTWNYSSTGVGGLKVPAGGSIGWRWQNGGPRDLPRAAPTTENSSSPRPSPTPKPSAATRPSPSVRPTQATSPAAPAPRSAGARTPGAGGASAGSAGAGSTEGRTSRPGPAAEQSKKAQKAQQAKRAERRRADEKRRDPEAEGSRRSASTTADEEYEVTEPVTEPVAPASAAKDGSAQAATVAALVLLAGTGTAAAVVARRRRIG